MKKLNKFVLLIAAILFTVMVSAQKKTITTKSKPTMKTQTSITIQSNGDTIIGESEINFRDGGHQYHMFMNHDEVTEMYVDGKKISEQDFSKYDSVIKKVKEQIRKDKEQAEEDRKQAIKDQEQAEKDREESEKDREQATADEKEATMAREHAEQDMKQAKLDRNEAELDRAQSLKDMKQAEVDRKLAEEDQRIFNGIVNDLISEKVIKSKDDLVNLKLSMTELYVNGVKQPAGMQQKMKAKYLKGNHTQVKFYSDTRGRIISLDKDDAQ